MVTDTRSVVSRNSVNENEETKTEKEEFNRILRDLQGI